MSKEEYDILFKLILVGDSGVGKSNVLSRFVSNEYNDDSKATIGVEFGVKSLIVNDSNIKLQLWDTAGQERFRAITTSYYRGSDGALVVFDVTNENTFINVEKWISEMYNIIDKRKLSVIIIGNKTDMDKERIVSRERAEQLCKKYNFEYMEASAKNNDNIDNVFLTLAEQIYENKVIKKQMESRQIKTLSDLYYKPRDEIKIHFDEIRSKGCSC